MGMTIDECIAVFNHIKKNSTGDPLAELPPEGKELFDVAIDTMRKYQKIVDIVSLNDEEFKQCGLGGTERDIRGDSRWGEQLGLY